MALNAKKFILELIGISIVLLILTLIFVCFLLEGDKSVEIVTGYLVSFFIFMCGFFSIQWAFEKSLKVFMITVLGGMFLRFVLIAIALFLLMRYTGLQVFYFILSFVVFYIIYQAFEIRFINMRLSQKGRKWLRYSRQK